MLNLAPIWRHQAMDYGGVTERLSRLSLSGCSCTYANVSFTCSKAHARLLNRNNMTGSPRRSPRRSVTVAIRRSPRSPMPPSPPASSPTTRPSSAVQGGSSSLQGPSSSRQRTARNGSDTSLSDTSNDGDDDDDDDGYVDAEGFDQDGNDDDDSGSNEGQVDEEEEVEQQPSPSQDSDDDVAANIRTFKFGVVPKNFVSAKEATDPVPVDVLAHNMQSLVAGIWNAIHPLALVKCWGFRSPAVKKKIKVGKKHKFTDWNVTANPPPEDYPRASQFWTIAYNKKKYGVKMECT